jgi:hypothetical protein
VSPTSAAEGDAGAGVQVGAEARGCVGVRGRAARAKPVVLLREALVRVAKRGRLQAPGQGNLEPAGRVDSRGVPGRFCLLIRRDWVRVLSVFSCSLQHLPSALVLILPGYHNGRCRCKSCAHRHIGWYVWSGKLALSGLRWVNGDGGPSGAGSGFLGLDPASWGWIRLRQSGFGNPASAIRLRQSGFGIRLALGCRIWCSLTRVLGSWVWWNCQLG